MDTEHNYLIGHNIDDVREHYPQLDIRVVGEGETTVFEQSSYDYVIEVMTDNDIITKVL